MAETTSSDTVITDQIPSSGLFSKLPGEIRNRIYKLALTAHEHYLISPYNEHPVHPALTRTCKLIRSEALPIFYSQNIFMLSMYFEDRIRYAREWLKGLGAQNREHVGQVYVSVDSRQRYRRGVEYGSRQRHVFLDNMMLGTTLAVYGETVYELRLDGMSFET